MANEGFNTFVLGQTAATRAAATDSLPIIQDGVTKKALVSTITSYNVVGPGGGDDTAMLNSAFTGSASRPVMLSFGQYQVSAPLRIPIGGVVVGAGEVDSAQPWATGNLFRCCLNVMSPGNWVASRDIDGRVAVIYPGSYSLCRDFSIYSSAATAVVDGVQFQNVTWAYCTNIFVLNCNVGFSGISDGKIPQDGGNPQGNNNIANIIRGGAARQCQLGFSAWGINGGYCSDMEISQLWITATQGGAAIYVGSGWGNGRIVNCRIEDQGLGLDVENTGQILIASCLFDRNGAPIRIRNSSSISVAGCISASAGNNGGGTGGVGTHIFFGKNQFGSSACDNIQLTGNTYNIGASATGYSYGVESGTTVTNSGIFETGAGNTAVYKDSYSSGILTPFRVTLP